jgi:bloom syndrome protein
VQVVCLTATAGVHLRDSVMRTLGLPPLSCLWFDATDMRLNLYLSVSIAKCRSQALSIASMCVMEAPEGSCALVYCRKKADCELCCQAFSDTLPSLSTVVYHAGLTPVLRKQILLDVKRGLHHVVVCTVAFGLGVDIENIAVVVHLFEPESVAQYLQEVGRAGRRGQAASCTLIPGFSTVEKVRERLCVLNSKADEIYEAACEMEYYCNMYTSCRHKWLLQSMGYDDYDCYQCCQGRCDNCTMGVCSACQLRTNTQPSPDRMQEDM